MNCRNCKQPVLDGKLLCPACVAELSHKAMLNVQGDFLPAAMRGHPQFRLLRRRGKREWHIEMLGYRGQGFCGVVFESARKHNDWDKRNLEFVKLELEESLCPECRTTLAAKAAAVAMEAR
jgi:hypothetical protein